jgi:hypothetical protein
MPWSKPSPAWKKGSATAISQLDAVLAEQDASAAHA